MWGIEFQNEMSNTDSSNGIVCLYSGLTWTHWAGVGVNHLKVAAMCGTCGN